MNDPRPSVIAAWYEFEDADEFHVQFDRPMDPAYNGEADDWTLSNASTALTTFGTRVWEAADTLRLADPGLVTTFPPNRGEYDPEGAGDIRSVDGELAYEWLGDVEDRSA